MKKVLVIGGLNVDILAKTNDKIKYHDSNPGNLSYSFGGVAKNIADNLGKLEVDVTFLTAVGSDQFGNEFIKTSKTSEFKLRYKEVSSTPTYLALLNHENDLEVAVAAMDSLKELDVNYLSDNKDFINEFDIIVLDTNLDDSVLEYIFNTFDKEIYVDGVSTFKVLKLKPHLEKINHLKVNYKEALALFDLEKLKIEDVLNFYKSSKVKNIYITDGSKGSYFLSNSKISYYSKSAKKILSTSGAGDAFFSGVIYANLNGLDPLVCGSALAQISLESEFTVSDKLNIKYLNKKIKEIENE